MESQTILEENIVFPSIVFKVRGGLYSVNSRHIAAILQLPEHEQLPEHPPCITGIFFYRGKVVQMLDLRSLFGLPTLEREYKDFSDMIDCRKAEHINWVRELDRTVKSGETFTLATDPHQCALGKWFDSFQTENTAVAFHLKKIEEPHKKLHEAAVEVEACTRECEKSARAECQKDVLCRVRDSYMPRILQLLDETKSIFKSDVYHEMVLLTNDEGGLGFVVDEVLSVEELEAAQGYDNRFHGSAYLAGVCKSGKIPGLIFELDIPKMIEFAAAGATLESPACEGSLIQL